MPSHCSASAPTAMTSRSARGRRCVTSMQKSSADPVTRCAASSGPHSHDRAVGRTQLHAERLRRRSQPVDGEREVAGAHADVRDRAQPSGRGPLHPERVGDVQTVRPGLHQPGGGHRRRRSSADRTTAACGRRRRSAVRRADGRGSRASRPGDVPAAARPAPRRLRRRNPSDPWLPRRAPPRSRPRRSPRSARRDRSTAGARSDGRSSSPEQGWRRPTRSAGRSATRASRSSLSARRSATIGSAVDMPVTLAG